jgi:predicted dehydrogenase
MQRILLIGFGFMGGTHAGVYRLLPDVRVVGVVDPRGEDIREDLRACGLERVPVFGEFDEAVAGLDFDVADICLPTDLHRDMVLRAFAAGKHVFCEKPIALTLEDAAAMTSAAGQASREFMVGHCIRFWPEYVELKNRFDSGLHGSLLSLSLSRRTGRPGYSFGDWVNKPERCLGAALDLHIHDTDFLLHLFGMPTAVVAQGLHDETGWTSITTQYGYDGRIVTADGAWNYPEKFGFQMRFSAVFECAVLDYDSRSGITLVSADGPAALLSLPPNDGYYHELAYFLGCLERKEPVAVSTGRQASESLRVVLTEIESARSGKTMPLIN